jgi:hypothetical protein
MIPPAPFGHNKTQRTRIYFMYIQGISERTEQQKITLFENDQITKQPVTILSYSYWSKLHDDSRKSGALRNGLR